jgi:Prokaryotic cytochrome b561
MLWNASVINGYAIEASGGRLGTVSDFLFEDASWMICWLVVDTGNWLSGRKVLLPPSVLGQPDAGLRQIPVKLTMQQVKDSPDVDTDRPMSRQLEIHVYDYYGWDPYWGTGYMSHRPMAAPFAAPPFLSGSMPRDLVGVDASRNQSDPHLRSMVPTMKARQTPQQRDPLEARLAKASGSIRPSSWLPPQWGEVPRIRLGKQRINVLWAIPLAFVVLVLGIAVCQELFESPWFQQFLARYPGIPISAQVHTGYPLWLRLQHFLNLFFMAFIIRSGIQILADHPRLYWNRDCTPETEWFRFQHAVPMDRVWTSKDDSVTLPKWLGIPGIRHSVGPARWWHFSVNLVWVLNGAAFYWMLFATDQWLRLVPTTWAIFPNALSMVIQYWSLHFPMDQSWTRYDALQQLTYFFTVFIAAPVQIGTGLMQSPAIANKIGWLGRPFTGRWRERCISSGFYGLCCSSWST